MALIIKQSKTHVPQIKANKMGMWRTGSHLAGSVCDALGKAKGHKLATCRGPECSAEISAECSAEISADLERLLEVVLAHTMSPF